MSDALTRIKTVKTRKAHDCYDCGQTFPSNTQMSVLVGELKGISCTVYACACCDAKYTAALEAGEIKEYGQGKKPSFFTSIQVHIR